MMKDTSGPGIHEGLKFFDSEMGLHGILVFVGGEMCKVWWADGSRHSWCLTEDVVNDINSGIIRIIESSTDKIS